MSAKWSQESPLAEETLKKEVLGGQAKTTHPPQPEKVHDFPSSAALKNVLKPLDWKVSRILSSQSDILKECQFHMGSFRVF